MRKTKRPPVAQTVWKSTERITGAVLLAALEQASQASGDRAFTNYVILYEDYYDDKVRLVRPRILRNERVRGKSDVQTYGFYLSTKKDGSEPLCIDPDKSYKRIRLSVDSDGPNFANLKETIHNFVPGVNAKAEALAAALAKYLPAPVTKAGTQ